MITAADRNAPDFLFCAFVNLSLQEVKPFESLNLELSQEKMSTSKNNCLVCYPRQFICLAFHCFAQFFAQSAI